MVFFRRVVGVGMAVCAAVAACSSASAQKSHQFDNNTVITIPGIGTANPYPSTIAAAGVTGPIGAVKVVLRGLNHSIPYELSILLVGPGGQNVLLMGRVADTTGNPETYIIAQDAPPFPLLAPTPSGRYAPTRSNFTPGLNAPAPAGPYGETLDVFKGQGSGSANGTWSLYVIDQFNFDGGTLAGWSLIIEEAPLITARASLTIPGGAPVTTTGPAAPYPAPVLVDGVDGKVQSVRVLLHGLSHTFQADLRLMLRGPLGQTCLLYSRCGVTGPGWTNAELIFDDAAAAFLPTSALAAPGVYKPTICNATTGNLAAPAPAGPYGTTLSVFNGSNPNGIWDLYIEDAANQDFGQLAGGWSLIVNDQVCKADFNGVGGVTIDDLFLYINAYFTGCP